MESIEKSTTPVAKRQPRAVSKELALSAFESGVSYMLKAGWELRFDVEYDEQGVPTACVKVVACDFVVDANGQGTFEPYATSPETVVADTEPSKPTLVA